MLDIIKNGLRNNDYYICLYPKHIYIYNYIEIITFTNEFIIISFSDFNNQYKCTDSKDNNKRKGQQA